MVTVPYYILGREEVFEIARLKLEQLRARVRENHGAELSFAPEVVATIAERSADALAGARAIDTIVNHDLLPELSRELLLQIGYGKPLVRVHVTLDRRGGFDFDFAPTAGARMADAASAPPPFASAPRPAPPSAPPPAAKPPRAPERAPVYDPDAAPVPHDMVVPGAPPSEPEPRPAPPAAPEPTSRDDAPRTLRRSDAGRSIDEISQLVPPKYKGWRQWYAELRSQFPEKDEE